MERESLRDIIDRFQNDKIAGYSHDGETLRLELESPLAPVILSGSRFLNLVLQNCPSVSYLSYTQTLAGRTEQRNLPEIFNKGLVIQGVEAQLNQYFLIYCNSYLNKVEAGELHLRTSGFQLYDQEFGRVEIPYFLRIADKIKRF